MVVIRLARHGAHNAPFYRIVVADQRKRRDGRIIEQVGTYDTSVRSLCDHPRPREGRRVDTKGAQPSDRVAKIIAEVKGEPLPKKIQARADLKAAEKAAAEKAAAEKAAAEAAAKAAEEAAEEE